MSTPYRTPALARAMRLLIAEFPGIRFGIYNRRKISGSETWSQHSWPNALDIVFTKYGDTSWTHQAQLDKVYEYIMDNAVLFKARYVLWRRRNHWDHIHLDFWPMGYGTPAVKRGGSSNMYKTVDQRIITQAELDQEGEDELALLTEAEQQELKNFLAVIREADSSVYFAKYAIQLIREEREKPLHIHENQLELFDPNDYEIIIQRKEV